MSRIRPRRAQSISMPKGNYFQKQNPDIFYTDDDIKAEHHHECRICLQGQISGNKLIAPCKCTGSVQYIHEQCMKQWIQKGIQKKMEPITCQLCKQLIMYSMSTFRQCSKWEAVLLRIKSNTKIFIFLLFLFLVNFGVLIYLIVLFIRTLQLNNDNAQFIEIGVLSFSIALLVIISVLLLGILIRQFVYVEVKRITGVFSMINNQRKSSIMSLGKTDTTGLSLLNVSKAKIHPLTIAQMDQIQ